MEALKRLEQELQCAICLDTFTDPRLLICGHVFCSACLPKLVYPQDSLSCPTCRKVTPYPESGVKGLQPAFRINSLLEIHDSLKSDLSSGSHRSLIEIQYSLRRSDSNSSLEEDRDTSTNSLSSSLAEVSCCTDHPKQELKLYCEKCEKLVCIECAIAGAEHHAHNPVMLEKTSAKTKDEMKSSLKPLKAHISNISSALGAIGTTSQAISEQEGVIEADILNTTKLLHKALDTRTSELIGQLHQRSHMKLKGLSSQRDDLETVLVKFQHCEATVEERISNGSDIEIVRSKESIMERIQSLTSSFHPELLKPNASASLEFSTGNAAQTCMAYGTLTDHEILPDPSKCFVTFKDLESSLEVGQKGSVHLRTMDSNDEPFERDIQSLECEFISELTGKKTEVFVERPENNLYSMSFTPSVKGVHQLVVKVNSQHVAGSPLTVHVHQSFATDCSKIFSIKGVVQPWGVAVNHNGEIIVSEKAKNRISIFSPRGVKLRSFGKKGSEEGQFKKPCGVAVDSSGNIFVADKKNCRIQKFTSDGSFLKAAGKKGKGDLEFEKLRGLAFNSYNNKIYAIDGNRIKILDTDLNYISKFGKFPSDKTKDKTFSMPVSVACHPNGQVYVADCMNNRIVILTPQGEFVRSLGRFHVTKQTFNHPVGVAVDNEGLIYLSQLINAHNRVSVVTPEGDLVKELDGGSGIEWGTIYTPIGLTVDANGVLYVCEFNSNRVVLY